MYSFSCFENVYEITVRDTYRVVCVCVSRQETNRFLIYNNFDERYYKVVSSLRYF